MTRREKSICQKTTTKNDVLGYTKRREKESMSCTWKPNYKPEERHTQKEKAQVLTPSTAWWTCREAPVKT